MRFVYLDPPYPGQAKRHYGMPEVDHAALIHEATHDYDGFALSTSSSALQELLPIFNCKIRVAAWVKPFCAFKANVNPAYAWEPVIFRTPRITRSRALPTIRDWHSENITLKKGLCGAKPERFCAWLFDLLGLELEDTFEDRFPGTNAVGIAYEKWRAAKAGSA